MGSATYKRENPKHLGPGVYYDGTNNKYKRMHADSCRGVIEAGVAPFNQGILQGFSPPPPRSLRVPYQMSY